jgi:hypothetical protein
MRTNLITLAVLIIALSSLPSCQKSEIAEAGISSKVKIYIEDATNTPYNRVDSFNLSYDANNRIISMISASSGAQFLYNYNSNTSYTLDIMNASHLIIRETSFINSDLLVDSTFQYNDTNDSSTVKLIYNSGKQLIQQLEYSYSTANGSQLLNKVGFMYDNNGNLIKETEKSPSGNTNVITTYTYNNIIVNLFTLSTIYRPMPFKNLPISITYFYPSTNATDSVTITYTYDNNNRVSTETHTDNNGNVVIKKYLYF